MDSQHQWVEFYNKVEYGVMDKPEKTDYQKCCEVRSVFQTLTGQSINQAPIIFTVYKFTRWNAIDCDIQYNKCWHNGINSISEEFNPVLRNIKQGFCQLRIHFCFPHIPNNVDYYSWDNQHDSANIEANLGHNEVNLTQSNSQYCKKWARD